MGYGEGGKDGVHGDHYSSGSGPCFVATACYGEHSDITHSLRRWRDEAIANRHRAKIIFIRLYYALWGRPGSLLLNWFPFLKPISRKIILLFMQINKIKIKGPLN